MIHHRSLFKEAAMLSTHVNEPLLELRYKTAKIHQSFCKISMTQIPISMIQVQKWLMTVRNGKYLMKRFATSHRSLQTAISRNAISKKECHKPTAVKTFGMRKG